MPCDMAKLLPIAQKHSLPLIEDAACAIGSEILWNGKWERVGRTRGDVACFSFHPRKIVSTGDGGMLATNNPDFDKRFKLLRHMLGSPLHIAIMAGVMVVVMAAAMMMMR